MNSPSNIKKERFNYNKIPNFNYLDDIFLAVFNNTKFPCLKIEQAGGRFSGKTIANFTLFAEIFALGKHAKVRIYVFRKRANTIFNTVFEEFRNALARIGIKKYLEHVSQMYFSNGSSKISFHSFNDRTSDGVSLTGLATAQKYTHAIKYFEERYEFEKEDIEDANEAVRGARYNMTINAANPWKKNHEWVQEIHQIYPFLIRKLKKNGYQIKLINNVLYHYMNYMINPYLSKEFVERLERLKLENPRRALTVCYGYPGELKGSIYAYAMDYVDRIDPYIIMKNEAEYIMIVGGLDFGFRNDAMTCIISGIHANYNKIDIIREYFFNPQTTHKDLSTIAREIITMCSEIIEDYSYVSYPPNYPHTPHLVRGITVKCDYSEISFIHLLQNLVAKTPYHGLITFEACRKIEVVRRVTLQLNLMESGIIRVAHTCYNFWRELELAQWDEKKHTDTVVDKDNHTQDAFHYGVIIPFFNDLQEKVNYQMWSK